MTVAPLKISKIFPDGSQKEDEVLSLNEHKLSIIILGRTSDSAHFAHAYGQQQQDCRALEHRVRRKLYGDNRYLCTEREQCGNTAFDSDSRNRRAVLYRAAAQKRGTFCVISTVHL